MSSSRQRSELLDVYLFCTRISNPLFSFGSGSPRIFMHFRQTLVQAVGNRGYTALGEQTLDPGKQKKGDTKESYYISSKQASHITLAISIIKVS